MCTTANNREIIEPRIIQLVRELTAAPATDEVADALKPVMEQVVDQAASSSQGGKRLRALLALDAFDILAGDVTPDRRDAMIDLACAIEVFQTAALVHDDIIDESDLRRGRPSAHRALEQAVHSGAIGRGLGLMLGVETERPVKDVISECMARGVLVISAKNKVRLLPALNIPMAQLEQAVSVLKDVCAGE